MNEATEPPLEVVKREWKAFAGFVACLAILFVAMLAPQTFMMLIAVVLVLATIIILYMLKTGDLQKMLNKKAEPDKEPEQKEDKGEVKQ